MKHLASSKSESLSTRDLIVFVAVNLLLVDLLVYLAEHYELGLVSGKAKQKVSDVQA
jgi:hypothetical protein